MDTEKTFNIVTHNGKFHADDICAISVLLLLYPNAKVKRTREEKDILNADIVVDVGGIYDHEKKRYDHHQKDGSGMRENGISYASFGLVWKHYGMELCKSKDVWEKFDKELVQAVDALDNGQDIFMVNKEEIEIPTFSTIISKFNPTWKEKNASFDEIFNQTIPFIQGIVKRYIKRIEDLEEASLIVEDIYKNTEDKRLIMLDIGIPWKDVLVKYEEPLFVIYPDDTSGYWCLQAVPKSLNSFENRLNMPKEWGGLSGKALQDMTGIEGAHFCHSKLFFAVVKTKEGIIEMAHKILEK